MPNGKTLAERLADDGDPLRSRLQAARTWHIPPTVILGERTVHTTEWTPRDVDLLLALEDYEAGYCPGGPHPLAETALPEHDDAYRPGEPIICHYCRAQAALAEAAEKDEHSAGKLVPIVLNLDVVALNKLPKPPLPPELAAALSESEPT
jgi:hypothetical protein